MEFRVAASLFVLCAVTSVANAQCADGSPPPCQSRGARTPLRPDPNRVAVLPFRVTTSDTLLGEGFAELLASEFTGEGVPRAADMGAVLQAWHRAGGGTRRALTRQQMLGIGRDVGAGLIVEGTIVGLGRQITVTANVLSVPGGEPKGQSARITLSGDSLERAVRTIAAQSIANSGATTATGSTESQSNSPEAIRVYLRGMREWRRGNLDRAAAMLDTAITLDPKYARAVYRRYLAGQWGLFTEISDSVVWSMRERLSAQDRAILTALLGEHFPAKRHVRDRIAAFEKLSTTIPDSPDVLYFLGDDWYHFGSALDPDRQMSVARAYFERAVAIDSQVTVLAHLFSLAVLQRDTPLIRRVANAYDRVGGAGRWAAKWIAAAETGDGAAVAHLRTLRPDDVNPSNAPVLVSLTNARMRAAVMEQMFAVWEKARPGYVSDLRTNLAYYRSVHGRPAAAESLWSKAEPGSHGLVDVGRLVTALQDADAGMLDLDQTLRRVKAPHEKAEGLNRFASCLAVAWRARHAETDRLDAGTCREDFASTAWTVDLFRTPPADGVTPFAWLVRADSVLQMSLEGAGVIGGYEGYLLAQAWERIGRPDSALAAIRRFRLGGFGASEAPATRPYEAKLALQIGDTTSAVKALRLYVEIMADAEPRFAAKVAAAKADLARVTKRAPR